jgi:hypothetical protein
MYKRLYLLVEGNDDERFFKHIIKPLLINEYDYIKIWQYAQKSPDIKNRFLRSIKAMRADYIYIADMDDANCVTERKGKIISKLDHLSEDKVIVVIKEIESWYLAGINREKSEGIGITYLSNTNNIYKEDFNNFIPDRFDSRIDFMQEIIKSFCIDTGKMKNNSLKYFFEKFIDPIISKNGEQVAPTSE